MTNIFAYTETEHPGTHLPGFISINEHDGKLSILTRSRGLGHVNSIELPADKIVDLYSALQRVGGRA